MTHIPNKLKPGDKVAVIATARVTDISAVETGIDLIKSWGLEVVTGKSLFNSHHLFAGTDQQRLNDLQWALDNESIKAILCARGGYGTSRILDSVNLSGLRKYPKWICGFSDVTALLCHIQQFGIAGIHSSMPQLFNNQGAERDAESLRKALFEGEIILEAPACRYNRTGTAEAALVGGNLSLLVHLIGTTSDINTEGKILVLEEVDEYLYHLDRMMIQLARSRKLDNLAGLMVGHLTKMKEGNLQFGKDAMGVISSHFQQTTIPIGFGFPFGHQSPNLAVPLGVVCQLKVTAKGSRLTSKY
ncbi:MAG: peptidase S66 [Cyclobacteriaceae bacterium]|nr:MAG: peptidase S66 [Cyclobacteriaceae bacterium]